MVRKATQKQLYFNVFIGLVILYFVLYRVLQQKTWNDALAAIRTGDVNRTHSQVVHVKEVNIYQPCKCSAM